MKWDEAVSIYINFARLLVQRDRRIYRETMMSKLENVASRAPQILADLEARAEQLDKRLSGLDEKGRSTFARWDSHLDKQDQAVAAAEDAINRLSNSPLPDSPPEPPFPQPGAGDGAEKS